MQIRACQPEDIHTIFVLYDAARQLQTEKKMVTWPRFEKALIENEIIEQRQWKLVIEDVMVCNWTIAFEDKDIWEEKEESDAIYIHRIAAHPAHRGRRYINEIVSWAKDFALHRDRKFVRLDTLGNNTRLIEHYTSAGFRFLGIFSLSNTANLPAHYHTEPRCCLFEMTVDH